MESCPNIQITHFKRMQKEINFFSVKNKYNRKASNVNNRVGKS